MICMVCSYNAKKKKKKKNLDFQCNMEPKYGFSTSKHSYNNRTVLLLHGQLPPPFGNCKAQGWTSNLLLKILLGCHFRNHFATSFCTRDHSIHSTCKSSTFSTILHYKWQSKKKILKKITFAMEKVTFTWHSYVENTL